MAPLLAGATLFFAATTGGDNLAAKESAEPDERLVCYTDGCVTFPPLSQEAVEFRSNATREPEIFISNSDRGISVTAFYGFGEIRFNDYETELSNCKDQPQPAGPYRFYYHLDRSTMGKERCRRLSLTHLSSLEQAREMMRALDVEIVLLGELKAEDDESIMTRKIVAQLGRDDFR